MKKKGPSRPPAISSVPGAVAGAYPGSCGARWFFHRGRVDTLPEPGASAGTVRRRAPAPDISRHRARARARP